MSDCVQKAEYEISRPIVPHETSHVNDRIGTEHGAEAEAEGEYDKTSYRDNVHNGGGRRGPEAEAGGEH